MPTAPKPNRQQRRKAKYGIPKEAKTSILQQQIDQFKQTLFGHETNVDRLDAQLAALGDKPAEGTDDPNADERESFETAIQNEIKAMDTIEAAIEATQTKLDAIKA